MSENNVNVLHMVEEIQIKIEALEGLMRVCSAAFSHKTIDCMNADDICGTFDSLHYQLEEVAAECGELIIAITDGKADMK